VLKDVTPEQLLEAVRVVASGEALLSPAVTTRLVADLVRRPAAGTVDERRLAALTDRERDVLRLVARGLSNADVARRLVVSPATAKTHVSRLLAKLGLHDRAQLVVAAYESGLVVPGQVD
jgi:DNA-binding NarL/FixJ family response regulator